jgi:hypothetical protein
VILGLVKDGQQRLSWCEGDASPLAGDRVPDPRKCSRSHRDATCPLCLATDPPTEDGGQFIFQRTPRRTRCRRPSTGRQPCVCDVVEQSVRRLTWPYFTSSTKRQFRCRRSRQRGTADVGMGRGASRHALARSELYFDLALGQEATNLALQYPFFRLRHLGKHGPQSLQQPGNHR